MYVDDRSWATEGPKQCLDFGAKWKEWSLFLGLRENETKEKYYHRSQKGRDELLAEGAPSKAVDSALGLLGVELAPEGGRPFTSKEVARVQAAELVAKRCACLPLSSFQKLRYASAKAVPKAAYGWFCCPPKPSTFKRLDAMIARAGPNPSQGDASLKQLFRGHSSSAAFAAGQQVLMAAWRRAVKSNKPPGIFREEGWVMTLRAFLEANGFTESGPWRWAAPCESSRVIDLDPSSSDFIRSKGEMGHVLREAWRQTLFEKWRARNLVTSRVCKSGQYSEARCTATRKLVGDHPHRFAVVCGAPVSFQRRAVMEPSRAKEKGCSKRARMIQCPWCKGREAPDWDHVCWRCPANGRAPYLAPPTDPLQRRLGWASMARTPAYNRDVLDWMAEIRQRVIEEQPRKARKPQMPKGEPVPQQEERKRRQLNFSLAQQQERKRRRLPIFLLS